MSVNWDLIKKLAHAVSLAGNAGAGQVTLATADVHELLSTVEDFDKKLAAKTSEFNSLHDVNAQMAERIAKIEAEAQSPKKSKKADAEKSGDDAKA